MVTGTESVESIDNAGEHMRNMSNMVRRLRNLAVGMFILFTTAAVLSLYLDENHAKHEMLILSSLLFAMTPVVVNSLYVRLRTSSTLPPGNRPLMLSHRGMHVTVSANGGSISSDWRITEDGPEYDQACSEMDPETITYWNSMVDGAESAILAACVAWPSYRLAEGFAEVVDTVRASLDNNL